LKKVPDDCVVKFRPSGRYRIENTLSIVNKRKVTLDGNGATLFETTRGYRERSVLAVVGGSDITVRGFHLHGVNPAGGVNGEYVPGLEAQHGIELFGPHRVLIKDNTISDVWGDFIYLSRDQRKKFKSWGRPSRDITITHNTMARNGRQGISFINVSRALVVKNRISNVRRTVFDFEPNTFAEHARNVTIIRNKVGAHRLDFVSAGGNGSVDNIRVADNRLFRSTMNTKIRNAPGQTRRNFSLVRNRSDHGLGSKLGAAVIAQGVEGIEFRDNVQPMSRRELTDDPMAGMLLVASCGGIASGNRMGPYGGQQLVGNNPDCAQPISLGVVARPEPVRTHHRS
jgi:hypothetical protein